VQSTPTATKERVATIDILRGVSLLGILLVNMFAFSTPVPYVDLKTYFSTPLDISYHKWLDILVQGSFYPLFAMLFGYGLAMQQEKAEWLGNSFYKLSIKRLIVLFIIGLLHVLFLWWGDILMMYAFCGLIAVSLIRMKPQFLLAIGLLFYGAINGLVALLAYIASLVKASSDTFEYADIQAVQSAIKAYGGGSWMDAFQQRLTDASVQFSPSMWIMALFTILPFMLIGAAAAKWKLIESAKNHLSKWIVAAVVLIVLGIILKMLPYTMDRTYFLDSIQMQFGGPLLAVGYASAIILICCIPYATKILLPFAMAGRMSLTVYLLESLICTLIFYHFGLGLYGKLGLDTITWLALGIYAILAVFSMFWLLIFRQGPLESLWKRITYGKISEKRGNI